MGLFDKVKSGWDDAVSNVSKAAQKAYDASLPKLITTGHNTITDKAGEAWSKAVDDTGVSKTVGDTATALYDASLPKLITTGSNTITDKAGELWAAASEGISGAADTVQSTVSNIPGAVKDTVQNVTKGVSEALPIVAIGAAALIGLALLFGRR